MEGPRGTRKEEFNQVLELVNYVFRQSYNQPPNMGEWHSLLFNYDNLDNMRIIVEDNKPVSHIGISKSEITVYGCRTKVGSIGSVCTHPEYRGRGLATKLLEDCIRKLNEDEVDIMLVSGGRGLYKRAGCVEAGRVHNFRISWDDLEKFERQDIKVFPYEERDLADVMAIYQKEPVRFCRPLEDFRKVLGSGAAMDRKAETLIVRMADNFLGYLVVQTPAEVKEGEKRVANVVEYAGVRTAIAGAISSLFNRYGIQEIGFNIPFHDIEFIYTFKRKELESTMGNIPGTIKIINFPGLMDRFRPYISERLGKKKKDSLTFTREDDRFAVYFGEEQFNTDGKSLVQIVFGTGDGKQEKMIPREGEMSKILRDIFPLPFVWPGLNSV